MIRLIKIRTIFIVLLLICLLSGLIYSLAANPITLIDWAKGIGGISFLLSAITLGLGQTKIFDFMCPLFGMPNLTGTYKGENRSNWRRVKEPTKGKKARKNVKLLTVPCEAKIISRLLNIRIMYASNTGYTNSTERWAIPTKDEKGHFYLEYMYDATTPEPAGTDSTDHIGAAKLMLLADQSPVTMSGPYWTNRNWHLGLNTAGQIKLVKTERK